MASADPVYHRGPSRCCATGVMYSPASPDSRQFCEMLPVQGVRLVLRENTDAQIARIDEVRQHEIDEPVAAAERNGRLGPIRRQGIQPLALPAGGRCPARVALPSWGQTYRHPPEVASAMTRFQNSPGLGPVSPPQSLRGPPWHHRRSVCGGDDDTGVSARGVRRCRRTRHRTRRPAAPAVPVDVHCMGAPRPDQADVHVHRPDPAVADANAALSTLSADLGMANAAAGADVVHSHTWYTGMAGHLAALLYGVPHVLTAHCSNRCGRGRPNSSAGVIASRPGWSARPSRRPMGDRRQRHARGCAAGVPALDPARVHVVKQLIDTGGWHP